MKIYPLNSQPPSESKTLKPTFQFFAEEEGESDVFRVRWLSIDLFSSVSSRGRSANRPTLFTLASRSSVTSHNFAAHVVVCRC